MKIVVAKIARLRLLSVTLALFPALAFSAVPTIQYVGDSASYGPRVAPGSLASIFGTGLADGTDTATAFPLPTSLNSASVSVNGTTAPLLYVSPTQINFQVPSSTTAGSVKLTVTGPGGSSASFSFTVTAAAPSIYQYGANHAVVQNTDGTLNSDAAAAAPGSVITAYLTGQGALDNPVADGAAAPSSTLSRATGTATATIGSQSATIQFLGLTPGLTGLAQANITVPSSLTAGEYPLVITMGGYVSASALLSISGSATVINPLPLISTVSFANSNPNSIALYGTTAYVCNASRIVMVNVADATAPSYIGEFGDSVLGGFGDRCAISTSGTSPFLVEIVGNDSGATESLAVFSLSNPQAPALLAVASTPYGHIEDISFSSYYAIVTTSYITYQPGNGAIVSQHGDFVVFSFANPAAPVLAATLPQTSQPGSGSANLKPYADVVGTNDIYVASTTATGSSTVGMGALDVVDISFPGAPSAITQVTVPQASILLSFDVSGTTLLAAGNTLGQRNPGVPDFDFTGYLTLTAMDLRNVQVPAIISTTTTNIQVNGTFSTSAIGAGVFAVVNKPPATDNNGPSSLLIVDARTPTAPVIYPCQTQFGLSSVLGVANGYLLVPTSLGLHIYQLQL